MRVTSPTFNPQRRRGVILLVVLAMLTLLTVIGVTFVLYSDSAESTARIAMEGEKSVSLTQPASWPTDELMAYAFGQLIYDAEDDSAGQQSNLRGHSLARDIYGYYYDQSAGPLASSGSSTPVQSKAPDNDRPFRGTGRLDPDKDVVNFTTFKAGGTSSIRDPERKDVGTGSLVRTNPAIPNAYVGGFNPPYTFADRNHVFLANTDTDPATGNLRVTEPSFVRLASLPNNTLDPANPYWTDPAGDPSKSVRPRPVNHNGQFPAPASATGDVRNLPWGTQNDSVWIDLGVSPKTAPNGKRYKPMFAFLAIDLDGRVNVNAHGNVQGRDGSGTYAQRHASGQGWGAWEVSLERILNSGTAPLAGKNFVLNRQPGLNSAATLFDIPGGAAAHSYAPVNYNGSVETNVRGLLDAPLNLPGSMFGSAFSPFIYGDAGAYGQGRVFERSGSSTDSSYIGNERVHGATWHPTYLTTGNSQMKAENLAWTMGRFMRSPSKYSDSLIYQRGGFAASPNSSPFISTGRDTRFDKITTMSWDLDRPGLIPYFANTPSEGLIQANPTSLPTKAGNANFPPPPGGTGSDFDPIYRANSSMAAIKRLNLNRVGGFTQYPAIDANGVYSSMAPMAPEVETDMEKAIKATKERQDFAGEILQTLIKATGAANPLDPADNAVFSPGRAGSGTNPRYLATRWLAQLAVNIVDNLDADDVMTPFAWNRHETLADKDYVFGHELPRVAINEVYAQVENAPDDYSKMASDPMGDNGFYVKVYTELVNPLPLDPFGDNSAYLQYGSKPIYKLDMVKRNTFVGAGAVCDYRDPLKDPLYSPTPGNGELTAQRLSGTDPLASTWLSGGGGTLNLKPMFAMRGTPGAIDTGTGADNGFLVVGPSPSMASEITETRWTPDSTKKDFINLPFEYQLKDAAGTIDKSIRMLNDLTDAQVPTMVLRRLADPGLAPSPTNPYIMVDFVEVTKKMIADNDGRKYIEDPENRGKLKVHMPTPIGSRKSFGKRQPFRYSPQSIAANPIDGSNPDYASYGSLIAASLGTAPTDAPNHTFWSINSNSGPTPSAGYQAFNNPNGFETPLPRIHLDRIITSPTELFTTPFCRPHEYMLLNDGNYSFCSPWLNTDNRLYRWLEFVQAGDTRSLVPTALGLASGIPNISVPVGNSGGRIPGKINLNTVSREVFFALCDAQAGNRFNDAQINAMYDQIVSLRPFWGNGVGVATGGDALSAGPRGRQQTIFANHPAGLGADMGDTLSLLMDPLHQAYNGGPLPTATGLIAPGTIPRQQEFHPSVRLELLNKILGRTTSRSNCFSVWLTVGFFEVITETGGNAPTAQPVHVLGKELEPKIRKRFFAMVDRTSLERWKTNILDATNNPMSTPDPLYDMDTLHDYYEMPLSSLYVPAATPITLSQPNAVSNTLNLKQFSISIGNVLTIDPGNTFYEETVEVIDIGMGTPGIRLKKAHPSMIISSRGNPGPMPNLGLDYKIEKDTEVVPYFAVLE
jgi:hypothetical protein